MKRRRRAIDSAECGVVRIAVEGCIGGRRAQAALEWRRDERDAIRTCSNRHIGRTGDALRFARRYGQRWLNVASRRWRSLLDCRLRGKGSGVLLGNSGVSLRNVLRERLPTPLVLHWRNL